MVNAAYAIVALPLLGFIINLVSGRRLGEPVAGWVGTVAECTGRVGTGRVSATRQPPGPGTRVSRARPGGGRW